MKGAFWSLRKKKLPYKIKATKQCLLSINKIFRAKCRVILSYDPVLERAIKYFIRSTCGEQSQEMTVRIKMLHQGPFAKVFSFHFASLKQNVRLENAAILRTRATTAVFTSSLKNKLEVSNFRLHLHTYRNTELCYYAAIGQKGNSFLG